MTKTTYKVGRREYLVTLDAGAAVERNRELTGSGQMLYEVRSGVYLLGPETAEGAAERERGRVFRFFHTDSATRLFRKDQQQIEDVFAAFYGETLEDFDADFASEQRTRLWDRITRGRTKVMPADDALQARLRADYLTMREQGRAA